MVLERRLKEPREVLGGKGLTYTRLITMVILMHLRPVARGIADATTSIEDGANRIAGGVKRAGEGK